MTQTNGHEMAFLALPRRALLQGQCLCQCECHFRRVCPRLQSGFPAACRRQSCCKTCCGGADDLSSSGNAAGQRQVAVCNRSRYHIVKVWQVYSNYIHRSDCRGRLTSRSRPPALIASLLEPGTSKSRRQRAEAGIRAGDAIKSLHQWGNGPCSNLIAIALCGLGRSPCTFR
jgi:hypothetical protein